MPDAPTVAATPAEAKRYARAVLAEVSEHLEQLLTHAAARGVEPSALGSPQEVARRMMRTIPEPSPWARVLGPVYTTASLRPLLGGVSRQAIEDRIKRGTLLALTTADRKRVFPAFQFDDDFRPIPGLSDVLAALRPAGEDWTIASWLTHPHPGLGDTAPIEWLRAGHPADRVLAIAQTTGKRWAA